MIKQTTITKLFLSWFTLIAIFIGSLNDPFVLGNAEFEDSIEIEKEVENDEKQIEAFRLHNFQFIQRIFELELEIKVQFNDLVALSNLDEKLYVLYHQLKTHLG